MDKNNIIFIYIVYSLALLLFACSKDEAIQFEVETGIDTQLELQDYIIAHRGYWTKNSVPENSRIAFKRALALKIYGAEFDVRQTKDGKIVVCHDAEFGGMKISNSTYHQLCSKTLANGETIPLLEEFLNIRNNSNTQVKLIIDIKECDVADLVEQINNYRLQDQVDYITFTKSYCQQLVKLGYSANTFFSSNSTTPEEIKDMGFGGVCYKSTFLITKPEYIDAISSLNIKIMVWTVNSPIDIYDFCLKKVYVITDAIEELYTK